MIDTPQGFTLTTTDTPSVELRPRPVLTVQRGPRNAGRSGVTLEPAPERFGVFDAVGYTERTGIRTLYLADKATRTPMVEVRIHAGADPLTEAQAICFLADLQTIAEQSGRAE